MCCFLLPPEVGKLMCRCTIPMLGRPLIWVECAVERPSRSRTDYIVKARSQFKERSAATNVEIVLPLPGDATRPESRCTAGSAVYAPERSALVWQIKNFPGGKEFMLRWVGAGC